MEPPAPALPVGMTAAPDGLDQRRILRAIDEAGQVTVVVIRPTNHLVRQRRVVVQRVHDGPRQVKDDIVRRPTQPHDHVVLGRGQGEAVASDHRRVEAGDPLWRRLSARSPQLRTETRDEVDATNRRAWLAQSRSRGDGRGRILARGNIELEIRVRVRAQGKDARLRYGHRRGTYAPGAR